MGAMAEQRRQKQKLHMPQWLLSLVILCFSYFCMQPVHAQQVSISAAQASVLTVSDTDASQSIVVTLIDSTGTQPSDVLQISWELASATAGSSPSSTQVTAERLAKGLQITGLLSASNYVVMVMDGQGTVILSTSNGEVSTTSLPPVPEFIGIRTLNNRSQERRLFFTLVENEASGTNSLISQDSVVLERLTLPTSSSSDPNTRCFGVSKEPGGFGSCCDNDNQCSSRVCDTGRRVCTMRCLQDKDCPVPLSDQRALTSRRCTKEESHNARSSYDPWDLSATLDAPRSVCDAARYVDYGQRTFCGDVCLGGSIIDLSIDNCPFDSQHPDSPCHTDTACYAIRQATLGSSSTTRRLASELERRGLGGVPNKQKQMPTNEQEKSNKPHEHQTSEVIDKLHSAIRHLAASSDQLCTEFKNAGTGGCALTSISEASDVLTCANLVLDWCTLAGGCLFNSGVQILEGATDRLPIENTPRSPLNVNDAGIAAFLAYSDQSGINCRVDQVGSNAQTEPYMCAASLVNYCDANSLECNDLRTWLNRACGGSMLHYCASSAALDPFCSHATLVASTIGLIDPLSEAAGLLSTELATVSAADVTTHGYGVYSVSLAGLDPLISELATTASSSGVGLDGNVLQLRLARGGVKSTSAHALSFKSHILRSTFESSAFVSAGTWFRKAHVGVTLETGGSEVEAPSLFVDVTIPVALQVDYFDVEWTVVDSASDILYPTRSMRIGISATSIGGSSSSSLDSSGQYRNVQVAINDIYPVASTVRVAINAHSIEWGDLPTFSPIPKDIHLPSLIYVREPVLSIIQNSVLMTGDGLVNTAHAIATISEQPFVRADDVLVKTEWSSTPAFVSNVVATSTLLLADEQSRNVTVDIFSTRARNPVFFRTRLEAAGAATSAYSTIVGVVPAHVPDAPVSVNLYFKSLTGTPAVTAVIVVEEPVSSYMWTSPAQGSNWPTFYRIKITHEQGTKEETIDVARASISSNTTDRRTNAQQQIIGALLGTYDSKMLDLCSGETTSGRFGDCCDSATQCASGVCDTQTRSCTLRCETPDDCPIEPLSLAPVCYTPLWVSNTDGHMNVCKSEKSMDIYGSSFCEYCQESNILACVFDSAHPLSPCATIPSSDAIQENPCVGSVAGGVTDSTAMSTACKVYVSQYCSEINSLDAGCTNPLVEALVTDTIETHCPFNATAPDSPCGPNLDSCRASGTFSPSTDCKRDIIFYCIAHPLDTECTSDILVRDLVNNIVTCPFIVPDNGGLIQDEGQIPFATEADSPCSTTSGCFVDYMDTLGTNYILFTQYSAIYDLLEPYMSDTFGGGSELSSTRLQRCKRTISAYCAIIASTDPACSLPDLRSWVGNLDTATPLADRCPSAYSQHVVNRAIDLGRDSQLLSLFEADLSEPTSSFSLAIDELMNVSVSACNTAGCSDPPTELSNTHPGIAGLGGVFIDTKQLCVNEVGIGAVMGQYRVTISEEWPSFPVEITVTSNDGLVRTEPSTIVLDAGSSSQIVNVFMAGQRFDQEGGPTFVTALSHVITDTSGVSGAFFATNSTVSIEVHKTGWTGVVAFPHFLEISEETSENSPPSLWLSLLSAPLTEATVSLSSDDLQITITPNVVIFDSKNWAVPVETIVTAVDDRYAEPTSQSQQINITVTSPDSPELDGQIWNVPVTNYDNDVVELVRSDDTGTGSVGFCQQGLLVDSSGVEVQMTPNKMVENSEQTFYIQFTTKPRFSVTISLVGEADAIVPLTSEIVVDPENWNVPVAVVVNAVDNQVDTGLETTAAQITCSLSSEDPDYNFQGGELFEISNEDKVGVIVSKQSVTVAEANEFGEFEIQDTFTIELATQPLAPVTIRVADVSDPNQVWLNPPTLQFDETTWSIPQQVTVSAVPDGKDNEPIQHTSEATVVITSEDPYYAVETISNILISITDAGAIADTTEPPIVMTAKLMETEDSIEVTFDRDSDTAGQVVGEIVACTSVGPPQVSVFAETTQELFGIGFQCQWETIRIVKVLLGEGYTAIGGDEISLAGGAVRANFESILYASGLVVLEGRTDPPMLTDAEFGDNGAQVFLTFEGVNSQQLAGSSDPVDCTTVFEDGSTLGSDSECQFIDETTMLVSLGVGAEVEPDLGDSTTPTSTPTTTPVVDTPTQTPTLATATPTISTARRLQTPNANSCKEGRSLSLRSGIITAVPGGVLSATGCISLRPPKNPPRPVPAITGVVSLGLCDDLTLSGAQSTGGAGRQMTTSWIIQSSSELLSDIDAYIDTSGNRNGRKVVVPRDLILPGETLSVILRAQNYLNSEVSESVVAVSKTALPIPAVRILGPKLITATRSREITLVVTGEAPSCGTAEGLKLIFSWEVISGDLDLSDPTVIEKLGKRVDTRVLKLPTGLLQIGKQYTFEATAAMASDETVFNKGQVDVQIISDIVVAKVAGPSAVGGSDGISLSAELSQDLDELVDIPFSFEWSCLEQETGNPCISLVDGLLVELSAYEAEGSTLEYGMGAILNLLPNILPSKTKYIFGLTISKQDLVSGGVRTSNTTFPLEIKDGSPPMVIIKPLAGGQNPKVNPSDFVVLTAEVTSKAPATLNWVWTNLDGKLDETDPSLLYSLGPINTLKLKIRKNILAPGSSYVFQLNAQDQMGEASQQITVKANAAPSSGFLSAHVVGNETKTDGVMLNTTFLISAFDWTDDSDDLPLEYSFSFKVGNATSTNAPQQISDYSQDNSIEYFFPRGDPDDGGIITIMASVRDRLGASVDTKRNSLGMPTYIYVDMATLNAEETSAFLEDASSGLLSDSVESGNPVVMFAVLNILADVMGGLDDPCSDVNCGTNGVCLEGICECKNLFTGDLCEIAPPEPIDGSFTEWSDWTMCSFACGGGQQTATRTCDNPIPEFGGLTCEEQGLGVSFRERECNTDPCVVVVDGGYSEWSSYTACSTSCEGTAGLFPGIMTRTRTCNNPAPSRDGKDCSEFGVAEETAACNLNRCSAPTKPCPGVGLVTDDTSGLKVLAVCSGHGECIRTKREELCTTEDNQCIVSCSCEDGWQGAKCQVDKAEMTKRRELRTKFIESMVGMSTQVETSNTALAQQAASLQSISSSPDEMGEAAQDLTFTFIDSMTGAVGGTDGLESATAGKMAGTVSNMVIATGLDKVGASVQVANTNSQTVDTVNGRRLRSLQDTTTLSEIKAAAEIAALKIRSTMSGIATAVVSASLPGEDGTSFDTDQLKMTVQKQDPSSLTSLPIVGGLSFSFPKSISVNESDGGNEVTIHALQWSANPYAWSNESSALIAGVTSMEFTSGGGNTIPVEQLSTPIKFSLPVSQPDELDTAVCSYWDVQQEKWTSRGMLIAGFETTSDGRINLICETLHLTDLSASQKDVLPKMNLVDPIGDAYLLFTIDPSNMMPLWVLIGLNITFIIMYFLGVRADKKKKHLLELYRKEKFLRTGKVLGAKDEMSSKRKMKMSVWKRFMDGIRSEHDWASVVAPDIPDHAVLTRPQRLAVLYCNCMAAISVAAMFYGQEQTSNVSSVLLIGVISSAMMLPSSAIFPFAFKYVNRISSPTTLRSRTRRAKKLRKRMFGKGKRRGCPSKTVPESKAAQDGENDKKKPKADVGVPNNGAQGVSRKGSELHVEDADADLASKNSKSSASAEPSISPDAGLVHAPDGPSLQKEAGTNARPPTLPPLNTMHGDVAGTSAATSPKDEDSVNTEHLVVTERQSPMHVQTAQVVSGRQSGLTVTGKQSPIHAPPSPSRASVQANDAIIKNMNMTLRKPVVKLKRLKQMNAYERYAIEERRRGRRPIPQHLHMMICKVQAYVRGRIQRNKYEMLVLETLRMQRYNHPKHIIPNGVLDTDLTKIKRFVPALKNKRAWAEKSRGGKALSEFYTFGEHRPVLKLQRVVRGYLARKRVEKLKYLINRIEEVKSAAMNQRMFRVKCAERIQSVFRGKIGRIRAERAEEYLRWKEQKGARNVLTVLVYTTVGLSILFTLYINVIYGIKFEQSQAVGWILASALSLSLDAFLQQPLSLLFKAFVGPYFAVLLSSIAPC